jgi:hypothetical protein
MIEDTHLGFEIVLGRSWFNKHNVTIAPAKNSIYIYSERTRIRLCSKEGELLPTPTVHNISAVAMQKHIQASKKDKSVSVFAASMANIQKALVPKAHLSLEQIRDLLPPSYHHQVQCLIQIKLLSFRHTVLKLTTTLSSSRKMERICRYHGARSTTCPEMNY